MESEHGKGTTFKFYLPCDDIHQSMILTHENILERIRSSNDLNVINSVIPSEGGKNFSPKRMVNFFDHSKYCQPLEHTRTEAQYLAMAQLEKAKSLDIPSLIRFPHWKTLEKQPEILIVDDDAYNVEVLKRLVERLGYKTTAVFDGRSAIERLTQSPYQCNLVLMDCYMPELDGLQATKLLKQKFAANELPEVPIIGITGANTEREQLLCKEAGMAEVLIKPVTKDQLAIYLSKYIHS